MCNTSILLDRNRLFASDYSSTDLTPMPKLRTIILACVDARVDPAHILGLKLGEACALRNNGGRVTQVVIDEIGALAFMFAMADESEPRPFELVLLQHTQCGAERFAHPGFQTALKAKPVWTWRMWQSRITNKVCKRISNVCEPRPRCPDK